MFRFKPAKEKTVFNESTKFCQLKLLASTLDQWLNFLVKVSRTSACENIPMICSTICSMPFAANIVVEHTTTRTTRFCGVDFCVSTHLAKTQNEFLSIAATLNDFVRTAEPV